MLPFAGLSPKLLTPSEFTSPVKQGYPELDEMVSSHPLLSPASILAAVTSTPSESGTHTNSVPDGGSPRSPPHLSQPLSESQDTLTCVSPGNTPASGSVLPSESVPSPCDDGGHGDGGHGDGGDDSDGTGSDGEVKADATLTEFEPLGVPSEVGQLRAADVPLPLETSSEEEVPTAEDTRTAFESIMELIDGGASGTSSLRKSTELVQSSFDDFAELLINPGKLRDQERELQSREEAFPKDSPALSEGCHSPVVGSDVASHSTTSFPDVLKSTSGQDPLTNTGEDAGDSDGGGTLDNQWPDIGVPELPRDTPRGGDVPEVVSVKGAVSNEFCQVGAGLLMPSALTEIQDVFQVRDNNLDIEVSNAAPDLLDQEISMESKTALEPEEVAVRTKSRSRKRPKRGKKQAVGLTEAPRYVLNIGNVVCIMTPFFPPAIVILMVILYK